MRVAAIRLYPRARHFPLERLLGGVGFSFSGMGFLVQGLRFEFSCCKLRPHPVGNIALKKKWVGQTAFGVKPVSDALTPFLSRKFETPKRVHSTRVVNIDVYYTICPFKILLLQSD
jgi:hypothetical protein